MHTLNLNWLAAVCTLFKTARAGSERKLRLGTIGTTLMECETERSPEDIDRNSHRPMKERQLHCSNREDFEMAGGQLGSHDF